MSTPNLKVSLLLLRWSMALVLLLWALDKFINPAHGAAIFAGFYHTGEVSHTIVYAAGALQLLIVAAFTIGFAKRFSYGAVLLMHGLTTVVSYAQYMEPFKYLLFFAAFPMLAACITLYLMRDEDTLLTVS